MSRPTVINAVMNELDVVNRTLQQVVEDLIGRGNNVFFVTSIRVSFDHHDSLTSQENRPLDIFFNVAYNPKSRYVAVL